MKSASFVVAALEATRSVHKKLFQKVQQDSSVVN